MERYPLYGGRINVDYDPLKHVYYVEDHPVNGITDALKVINKPFLIPWALKMGEEYLLDHLVPGQKLDELEIKRLGEGMKKAYTYKSADAADIGTLGHDWIERYYRGENPKEPINLQLRNITEAFLQFAEGHTIVPLHSEKLLYSVMHRFAGRVDMICMFDGKLAILDWKTSNDIYPEYFLQMGGYDIAYSEEQLFNIESARDFKPIELHIIVQCSKKGALNVAITGQVSRDSQGFLAALELTRSLKNVDTEMKDKKKAIKEAAKHAKSQSKS